MESKHNTKLLEPSWSQPSRSQRNLISCQVLHNLFDSLNIFWKFGIIGLVSLRDLFCEDISHRLSVSGRKNLHTVGA